MAYATGGINSYRFVDGYSRNHLRGPSMQMIRGQRDTLVTGGTSRRSYNPKPRFGSVSRRGVPVHLAGGRLHPGAAFDTHSRPTRFGGGRLVGPYRRFGQLDVVGEGVSAIESIMGGGGLSAIESIVGGGPPHGSSQDPRIMDLNAAYNQALGGQPAGLAYLNAWVADQPPHPAYSNTYARQLIALVQGGGGQPATSNTSPAQPPVAVPGIMSGLGLGTAGSIAGIPTWLVAAAVVGFVVLRK